MHAKFESQLENHITKNLETHIMSPIKDLQNKHAEHQNSTTTELQMTKLQHEMELLRSRLEAEKELALADLRGQMKALETEGKATLAQHETTAAEAASKLHKELEACKQQNDELQATLKARTAELEQVHVSDLRKHDPHLSRM